MTRLGLQLGTLILCGIVPLDTMGQSGESTSAPDTQSESEQPDEQNPNDSKADKSSEKTFQEVVKNTEKIEGLFTFYQNSDENKAIIEIEPDQFNTEYIYSQKLDRATGERGLYGTTMAVDYYIVRWRKLGSRVRLVRKNVRFRATEGSPSARAITNSFSDSVIGSGKILSLPNPEGGGVLVDLNEILFTQGFSEVTEQLKKSYETGYKFEKEDSKIVLLKSFPRNSELGLLTQFRAQELKKPSITLPNTKSLDLYLRISLATLPEGPYMPRLGDDRIGHFYDMHMDFSSDKTETPYVRYVRRWKLEKKDPDVSLSEPKEPIVFWLENSIPLEYREWIRNGALMWNPAFERIGFKDAIVVKQQPDDADWDPADIRYNTIRWFVSYDAAFAIGPSHSNPYTGQQLSADISLAESAVRLGARRRYETSIHPVRDLQELKATLEATDATGLPRQDSVGDGVPEAFRDGAWMVDSGAAVVGIADSDSHWRMRCLRWEFRFMRSKVGLTVEAAERSTSANAAGRPSKVPHIIRT